MCLCLQSRRRRRPLLKLKRSPAVGKGFQNGKGENINAYFCSPLSGNMLGIKIRKTLFIAIEMVDISEALKSRRQWQVPPGETSSLQSFEFSRLDLKA